MEIWERKEVPDLAYRSRSDCVLGCCVCGYLFIII